MDVGIFNHLLYVCGIRDPAYRRAPNGPGINTILQRFSGEWAALLQPDAILTVCRDMGYTAWRDRVLTPVTTVQLFPHSITFSGKARMSSPSP